MNKLFFITLLCYVLLMFHLYISDDFFSFPFEEERIRPAFRPFMLNYSKLFHQKFRRQRNKTKYL